MISIRHFGLVVKDLKRAIRWWSQLGFQVKVVSEEEWSERRLKIAKLELIEGDWRPHLALTFRLLRYQVRPWGIVLFVEDSEGNEVEMVCENHC